MASSWFSIANGFAVCGWAALAAGIALRRPFLRDTIAGLIVPLVLSVGYIVLLLGFSGGAEGSFSSLEGVAALFRTPWVLLAGWVHYLAFDLAVAARLAADAERENLSRLLMIPVLPLTFLFGPAGFLLFHAIKAASRARPSRLAHSAE